MALPENPITRKEAYLARIAGQEVQIPDVPITREEAYLNQIVKEGMGTKVIANPDDVAEDVLNKVEIDGEVYSLPSGGGGSSDYLELDNKPQINGVELKGNKTTSDLGIDKTAVGLGNVPNVSTNDQTPTFSEASTRNNIASGEKLSVILGKVQKFFNDLKTVAFSGSFSDLINKPENANTFQGTIAEWNALSTAEKKAYDHASIPDSIDGGVTFPADKVIMTGGGNVEEAVDEVNSGLTSLHYHKIAESASTGTYAVKLQSLATAYNSLSLAQKRSALLVINAVDVYHPVNCSGNWFSVWVESSGGYLTRYGIDGSAYVETGGTVTNNSSVENANVFELWICEP